MTDWALSVLIGFVSGILSGAFGIGGAIITTPAMALVLGVPAMIAVGTPLPVILPSAVTGAVAYAQHRLVDWRSGVVLGIVGSAASVLAALAADRVGGAVVLIGTALLIFWAAADTLRQVRQSDAERAAWVDAGEEADAAAMVADREANDAPVEPPNLALVRALLIGTMAGAYAGFFGLGGGFVFVPLLVRWGRFPLKQAIGTSLVAVAVLSVPSTITHALLGNVDWGIALSMVVGVVPGALLGARLSLGAGERALRVAFALMLAVAGAMLIAQQVRGL